MNVVVGSLRLGFPDAEFVDALALYRTHKDWNHRWTSERERCGAAIIVTRAEGLLPGTDPFAGKLDEWCGPAWADGMPKLQL
jgi:hypothetical protein